MRGFGSPDRTLPKPPFSTPRRELRLSTAPAGSKSNYKSGLKKKKKSLGGGSTAEGEGERQRGALDLRGHCFNEYILPPPPFSPRPPLHMPTLHRVKRRRLACVCPERLGLFSHFVLLGVPERTALLWPHSSSLGRAALSASPLLLRSSGGPPKAPFLSNKDPRHLSNHPPPPPPPPPSSPAQLS